MSKQILLDKWDVWAFAFAIFVGIIGFIYGFVCGYQFAIIGGW